MTAGQLNESQIQTEKLAHRPGKQLRSLFLSKLHGIDEFPWMHFT
jgi:hypothetical protein